MPMVFDTGDYDPASAKPFKLPRIDCFLRWSKRVGLRETRQRFPAFPEIYFRETFTCAAVAAATSREYRQTRRC